jgi:DNA-binding transcriptional MerR regulator
VSNVSGRSEYSIAAVSKLTGISCHALRVWERRYGFPVPRRSGAGHRRYDQEQVRLLARVATESRAGRSVGELIAGARAGRLEPSAEGESRGVAAAAVVVPLIGLLLAGDLAGAESEYDRLTAGRGAAEQVEQVIEPGLVESGERLFRGECPLGAERSASGFLMRKLLVLLDAAQRANHRPQRTLVVGAVQGDRHEGGALMAALALEQAGWRAVFVGADLPVRALQESVERWRPDAVALSFVLARNINKRFRELATLRHVPILVGGRSILNYQGLARRHGLIPLPGSARAAIGALESRVDAWWAERGARDPHPDQTRRLERTIALGERHS